MIKVSDAAFVQCEPVDGLDDSAHWRIGLLTTGEALRLQGGGDYVEFLAACVLRADGEPVGTADDWRRVPWRYAESVLLQVTRHNGLTGDEAKKG